MELVKGVYFSRMRVAAQMIAKFYTFPENRTGTHYVTQDNFNFK